MSDSLLARRYAFWDNTLWNLHQLIKDINASQACKWVNDKDEPVMTEIIGMLNAVDITASVRYREVLGDKIEAMRDALEAADGKDS